MPDAVRTLPQGNLKAFTGVHPTPDLFDELALAICEHHTALEHLCLQQQFNAWSVITSSLLQQPHAQSLRAFPVSAQQQTVGMMLDAFAANRPSGWSSPHHCPIYKQTATLECVDHQVCTRCLLCHELRVRCCCVCACLQAVQGLPAPFTGVQAID